MFIEICKDTKVSVANVVSIKKVISKAKNGGNFDFFLELLCVNKELICISFFSKDELDYVYDSIQCENKL